MNRTCCLFLLLLAYLRDHHMAVKSAFTTSRLGTINMRSDLGDHGSTKGDIGDEMAIHLCKATSKIMSVNEVCSMSPLRMPFSPVFLWKRVAWREERERTMSTCSQSAPSPMVFEHAAPRAAKSALRIEGAMIAGGAMVRTGLVGFGEKRIAWLMGVGLGGRRGIL